MIGNLVNLNTVMDTCQVDEPHTDKQHPTQMFPFETCLTFSLSQILPVLPLDSKRAKGEPSFALCLNNYLLTHSGAPLL